MGFFSKLFGASSPGPPPGTEARAEDGRIGSPERPWVCEPPDNLAEVRRRVLDALAAGPEPTDPAALDAILAEMMKGAFLRQVYGEEGKDWEAGIRMYLQGSIQTQEIRFKDGRAPELFCADFSRFG